MRLISSTFPDFMMEVERALRILDGAVFRIVSLSSFPAHRNVQLSTRTGNFPPSLSTSHV
ncbi:hypothetical protein BGW80DRAFT_1266280 [Lactifluus volemus]|nr:hypothetical protein BGW80DRAFT_1266280 [Lactifluus volemus]